MKNILIILIVLFCSCNSKPQSKRLQFLGVITSLRIDDDSEYHFSTDYVTESDVDKYQVHIQRENIDKPILYISQVSMSDSWVDDLYGGGYIINLPINYKIETFDD